jgi:tetratricopeptide (TPR) repeat protein
LPAHDPSSRGPIAGASEEFMSDQPAESTDPIDPRLVEVEAAIIAGELGRALSLAEKALAEGLTHPALFNLRAYKAELEGRFEASLADLRAAHALAPGDASILNAMGICCTRLGQYEEAVDALAKATALAPDFAQAWNNRGLAELAHGDLLAARTSFETAAALQPEFAEPRGQLALMAARRGDHDEARAAAEAALSLKSDLPEAVRALAEVDLAEDRPADAEQRLQAVLRDPQIGPNARYYSRLLLGDALDRQGRYAEAFEAYRTANLGQREVYAPQFARSGLIELLDALRETFDIAWPRGVEPDPPGQPSPARRHIFLIGFMRSGTTLMEQVLAALPDAVSLEEKEVLASGVTEFMRRPEGLARLAAADDRTLQAHRDDYWARVGRYGIDPTGKLFIDKMPFDGFRLPLIHRLFPDARIVMAIRDPRDVVLSCFRRRFAVTQFNYELLSLPTTTRLYDLFMRSVESFDARLPLRLHRYRHEDLVADFDGQVKALCDFLDAPWNEAMRDIGARSRRGLVTSPSAPQLLGGLSSQGVQQWRRYEDQLAPYFADLDPWVRKFGYG